MEVAMLAEDPDLEIVEALQAGKEITLNDLIYKYQNPLFRFIYRYTLNTEDAHELTQEVFVRVYFKIHQFKPRTKFATWLYRIATNLCHDHARSRSKRQSSQTDSFSSPLLDNETDQKFTTSTHRNPSEIFDFKERMEILQKAINELPHDLKTALILSVFEDRSHLECAEILGTTAKTIETRLYRARKWLSERLNRAGTDFF